MQENGLDALMEPCLQVHGLSVRYRANSRPVLRDLSFELDQGQIAGFFGESGAGKTTLGRALAGLLPVGAVFEGRVSVHGRERLAGTRGSGIHYFSQEAGAALHPLLTVGRQIRDAARLNSAGRVDVAKFLRSFHFDDPERIAAAYPHQLSGGEKRRAALARMLAAGAELTVLDEPTNGLDPLAQAGVLRLLMAKRREGFCAIVFSHDPGVLTALCDRVFVLCDGMVVESGPAQAVFSKRLHPLTAGILTSAPRGGGGPLLVLPDHADASGGGCPFEPRCPERMPDCTRALPPLKQVEEAHSVRCCRYD